MCVPVLVFGSRLRPPVGLARDRGWFADESYCRTKEDETAHVGQRTCNDVRRVCGHLIAKNRGAMTCEFEEELR